MLTSLIRTMLSMAIFGTGFSLMSSAFEVGDLVSLKGSDHLYIVAQIEESKLTLRGILDIGDFLRSIPPQEDPLWNLTVEGSLLSGFSETARETDARLMMVVFKPEPALKECSLAQIKEVPAETELATSKRLSWHDMFKAIGDRIIPSRYSH
jgi:hypothetical protein